MTEEIFRDDGYVRECEARIVRAGERGVVLDRSVFYPQGGGQPGDHGSLTLGDGTVLEVQDTVKGDTPGDILHVLAEPPPAGVEGTAVTARIDWDRRYRLMRTHTLLHVLGTVVPAGVTGGSIRDDGTGRLDFDLPESTLEKDDITAKVNEIVAADHPVRHRWVTEDELDRNPDLVRTLSVAPPRGQGRVRLLEIEGIDLQACGGTHVGRTGEIGEARVRKIEKKGRHNRRVNILLVEP